MRPFLKMRVTRRGLRDGKLGLPLVDEMNPSAIESLKKSAAVHMGNEMRTWRLKDTPIKQAYNAAKMAKERLASTLKEIEDDLATAVADDATAREPEQQRLDKNQAEKDELLRRFDAGESLNPSKPASSSQTIDVAPKRTGLTPEEIQDREGEKRSLREELELARQKLKNGGLPDGPSFWVYAAILAILVVGEFPLNFLGFRILKETDLLTVLIAALPAVVLIAGAHWTPALNYRFGRPAAIGLVLSVLFVILAVYQLRVAYIEDKLAGQNQGDTPVVVADGNPISTTSPSVAQSQGDLGSVEETGLGGLTSTGWGFFGLNYGAFVIALSASYLYHGSRQELRRRIAVDEKKLRRMHEEDGDDIADREDEDRRATQAALDAEGDSPQRKRTRREETQRRADFDREISKFTAAIKADQAKRGERERKLSDLRDIREATKNELDVASRDERQHQDERHGRARLVRDKLTTIQDRWNGLIQEYRTGNVRGRAKKGRGSEFPAGFAAANCIAPIPPEYLAELEDAIKS